VIRDGRSGPFDSRPGSSGPFRGELGDGLEGSIRTVGMIKWPVFNIEADPREAVNILGTNAWVIGPYLRVIGEYQKSLEKYPNPRAVNMTNFGR
jgi:hypothetical protein